MTTVIVEREFANPIGAAVLHDAERRAAWCMEAYGVEARLHYLARDGMRVVCVFSAPDAEALRQVATRARLDPHRRIWSCSVRDAGSPKTGPSRLAAPRSTVSVVERTLGAPAVPEDLQAIGRLEDVRWIRSYCSAGGSRVLSLFESRDAASVRRATERAGIPCDRIWEARIVLPLGVEGEPS